MCGIEHRAANTWPTRPSQNGIEKRRNCNCRHLPTGNIETDICMYVRFRIVSELRERDDE